MPKDKIVQLPDGRIVSFPAEMSDEAISGAIRADQQSTTSNVPEAGYLSGLKSSIPDPSSLMQSTLRRLAFGGIDPVGDLQTIKSIPSAIKAGAASASDVSPNNPLTQMIAKAAGGGAGALAPIVGVNPVSMRERALNADTSGILGEATIPTAAALLTAGGKFAAEKIAANSPAALRAQAGKTLGNIKQTAGDVPVDTSNFGDTAMELFANRQTGSQLPMAVRMLINRITQPGAEPLTYGEAKNFQSNISALSANERMNLKPDTARLIKQLNAGLKKSLEQAAQQGGVQPGTFSGAMKQYAQASSRQDMIDTLKELALKEGGKMATKGAIGGAATVASGGIAYKLLKELGIIP